MRMTSPKSNRNFPKSNRTSVKSNRNFPKSNRTSVKSNRKFREKSNTSLKNSVVKKNLFRKKLEKLEKSEKNKVLINKGKRYQSNYRETNIQKAVKVKLDKNLIKIIENKKN